MRDGGASTLISSAAALEQDNPRCGKTAAVQISSEVELLYRHNACSKK
jgi:hypothetical protein